MLTYPHINPIALQIGPLRIHWYGIMYLVAFAAAWILARRRAATPPCNWTSRDVDDFIFYAMMGTIIGGRVGYVLFYGLSMWHGDPWYPFKVWEGGMSFHGGFLGVLAASALFARQRGRNIGDVFDFAAPLPGIGICAVRIGNFINGELWGRPTDGWWAMRVSETAGGPLIGRHPSQLYEALLEGVVLFVIVWLYTRKPRPRYMPSAVFLLCYSLARITVEFVRLPDVQIGYLAGGWLTMGQVLSLPMLLTALILLNLPAKWRQPSGNYTVAK
jgi:phosphatidylglycerol:prolipoprotein diacylglycerol transferase